MSRAQLLDQAERHMSAARYCAGHTAWMLYFSARAELAAWHASRVP